MKLMLIYFFRHEILFLIFKCVNSKKPMNLRVELREAWMDQFVQQQADHFYVGATLLWNKLSTAQLTLVKESMPHALLCFLCSVI